MDRGGLITVWEAISQAEALLPGRAAPPGEIDPRWQAIIRIEDYIAEQPEAVWGFILRWGSHEDNDLRNAIATILLEHLLGHHFSNFFPRVASAVETNALLGDTFTKCWKVGEADKEGNAEQFDRLANACRARKQGV